MLNASWSQIRQLNQHVRDSLKRCASFEEAAQTATDVLFQHYPKTLALVRLYATIPFDRLLPPMQRFAQGIALSRAKNTPLVSDSQVLTLLGSRGLHADWNSRRTSRGHVAIPLVSSSFVSEIPMIARLLKELGADISWLDSGKGFLGKSLGGGLASVFYVEDASRAKDEVGRLVIPAQDFVSQYHIKTVFGVGGSYVNGQLLSLICFCREMVPKEKAEQFIVLANVIKATTVSLLTSRLFVDMPS